MSSDSLVILTHPTEKYGRELYEDIMPDGDVVSLAPASRTSDVDLTKPDYERWKGMDLPDGWPVDSVGGEIDSVNVANILGKYREGNYDSIAVMGGWADECVHNTIDSLYSAYREGMSEELRIDLITEGTVFQTWEGEITLETLFEESERPDVADPDVAETILDIADRYMDTIDSANIDQDKEERMRDVYESYVQKARPHEAKQYVEEYIEGQMQPDDGFRLTMV